MCGGLHQPKSNALKRTGNPSVGVVVKAHRVGHRHKYELAPALSVPWQHNTCVETGLGLRAVPRPNNRGSLAVRCGANGLPTP